MSFSFRPKNDAEIAELQNVGLLKDGLYPFIVKGIEEQLSKTGNPMLKVRFEIHEEDGSRRSIFDYLVATDLMMFKLKHFCESVGLNEQYEKGNLNLNDCLDRSGNCFIGTQKGTSKPDGSGMYPDKNVIKDFMNKKSVPPKAKGELPFNDDIKF